MSIFVAVVALGLAAVLLVAVGNRLRLPWPVLMVVLTAAAALLPGLPDVRIEPELTLPLLLPPLLWAVARRSSWSVFRSRWRAITTLAVLLVLASTAAVAVTAHLLSGTLTVAAAITLGALVAPPDPVAVESVAGSTRLPRRLLRVLQTEGLFNDAVSLVVFQQALRAATGGGGGVPEALLRFGYAVAVAVAIGVAAAWAAKAVLRRIADVAASAGLTLIVPFAVYLAADQAGASGVIAVVVAALTLGQVPAESAADRVVGDAFWRVVELLITGVAFGLIGLQLPDILAAAGDRLGSMLLHGLVVSVVLIALRLGWLLLFGVRVRHAADPDGAPRTSREALVMAWSGMRGLVTLALALSLPTTGFPDRVEVTVVAVVVLLVTLVGQGLTLPAVVRWSGVATDADAENAADEDLAGRARRAALTAIEQEDQRLGVPDEVRERVRERYTLAWQDLTGEPEGADRRKQLHEMKAKREAFARLGGVALAAARQEMVAARQERGVDPEAVDRVLRRLDVRALAARR